MQKKNEKSVKNDLAKHGLNKPIWIRPKIGLIFEGRGPYREGEKRERERKKKEKRKRRRRE